MTLGERHIRGIIRERKEAEQIYRQARSQGYVASLLTQERPNIFTQSVANIEPGKRIDIDIRYFNTLAYVDGWLSLSSRWLSARASIRRDRHDGIGAVGTGRARRIPDRRPRCTTFGPTSAAGTTSHWRSISTPACRSRGSTAATTKSR